MTDRQALLSAAGKQRPYKAVNIKPPAMPGDIYFYAPDLTVKSSYGIVLNYRKLNRDNYAYVERNGSKVQKNKLTLFFSCSMIPHLFVLFLYLSKNILVKSG